MRKPFDWIIPVFILIYSTVYFFEVYSLPRAEINMLLIKPVYYLLTIFIIIYFLIIVFNKLRKNKNITNNQEETNDESNEKINYKKTAVFFITTILYVFLLDYIGFIISSLVYMVYLMYYLGVKRYSLILIVPVSVVGLLFLSVEIWLNIRLPKGFLGF